MLQIVRMQKLVLLTYTLEIDNVTSKLESQILSTESAQPYLEIMFTETNDPTSRSKPQFRKTVIFVTNLITLF